MPTWLTAPFLPLPKVSRSPGRRWLVSFVTARPEPACCLAVRGTCRLNADMTYLIKPLQSKPLVGVVPPRLYRVPSCARAVATIESRRDSAELLNASNG